MLLSDILDSKVINNQCELDGTPGLPLKACCVLHFKISMLGQSLLEEVAGQNTGLGQAVYAFFWISQYMQILLLLSAQDPTV